MNPSVNTMNPVATTQFANVVDQAKQLVQSKQTLHLATLSQAGQPEASYAPFVQQGDNYYVYVSELAAHCGNLMHSARCAVLVIEDEAQAKTPFARQRLSVQCAAREVARGSAQFEQVMQAFHNRFGKFMIAIDEMLDFHLFELSPERGGYVAGFGRAYAFEGKEFGQMSWRNEKGHRMGEQPSVVATADGA